MASAGNLARALVAGAIALISGTPSWAAEAPDAPLLCGRTAASATALYFDVARQFDATVLRATDAETVIQSPNEGIVWIFVAKPVTAVLCRRLSAAGPIESFCSGDEATCRDVVRRLANNPRATP